MMEEWKPVSDEQEAPGEVEKQEIHLSADGELRPALIVEGIPAVERKEKPGETPWSWLRRILGIERSDDETFTRRLLALDQAIANEPDAPVNYVLRGELHLQARDYEHARDDFERGLELASAQVQENDWGIIAQTLQDRALLGRQKAEKGIERAANL